MNTVVLCLEPQDGWFVCRGSKPVSEKESSKRRMQWGILAIGDEAEQDVSVCSFVCRQCTGWRLVFQHLEKVCGCSLSVNNSLSFQEPHKWKHQPGSQRRRPAGIDGTGIGWKFPVLVSDTSVLC